MVQQDVIDYIKLGKERGYSVNLLKSKLLENGFAIQEINEAISIIENGEKPPVPQGKDYFNPPGNRINRLDQEKPLSRGKRWMKVSAIAGFVLLGLIIIQFVITLAAGFGLSNVGLGSLSPTIFSSISLGIGLSFLFMIVVAVVLGFLYFFGFAKFGNAVKSGGLKFTSWGIIILGLLTILAGIVFAIIIYLQFSSISSGVQNPTALFDIVAKILAYMGIVVVIGLLSSIFVLVFSIFLTRVKEVKFALASGILFLIFSLMCSFTFVTLVSVLLFPGALLMGSVDGFVLTMLKTIGNSYYGYAELVIGFAAIVFGSLTLLNASKKYE